MVHHRKEWGEEFLMTASQYTNGLAKDFKRPPQVSNDHQTRPATIISGLLY
jgi:hypothetical protein